MKIGNNEDHRFRERKVLIPQEISLARKDLPRADIRLNPFVEHDEFDERTGCRLVGGVANERMPATTNNPPKFCPI